MHEPERMIVRTRHATDEGLLLVGTVVWALEDADGDTVRVEWGSRRVRVPRRILEVLPVPSPREQLVARDPCILAPASDLETVFEDRERAFSVLRCEHGCFFLEEAVGTVGVGMRRVMLGEVETPSPEGFLEAWRRVHRRSSDHLRLLGMVV